MKMEGQSTIESIPPEILCKMFSYLPNSDFESCSAVSQQWQSICWNINLANFIIFIRDLKTNKIQEPENQQDDVNNDEPLENNNDVNNDEPLDNDGLLQNNNGPLQNNNNNNNVVVKKQEEPEVRHILIEMPVHTVIDQISNGEVELEESNFHHLTIPEIIKKLSAVPSALSVFRLDISLIMCAGDLENTEVQTLIKKFRGSIVELNLRRGSSFLSATKEMPIQTISNTLQLVQQNLQHFSFPIDLATNRIIPNPPFPQLTQLKTLRFRKPIGLRMSSTHNGLLIREILKTSSSVSHIYNFPLLLNVDIVRHPVRKCVSNLKAIKSLNYQECTSKLQYTRALSDLITTDSINNEDDDEIEVKEQEEVSKENQIQEKVCLSKLNIYSWFTDSSPNRSKCNKTFNEILELSKDSLSALKIQPLDSEWETPIVIPVLKNLEKITFVDQDRVNRRFFKAISPGSQISDPNDLFPNLKKVVLKLAFPSSWSMAKDNKFDSYFPLDTFNPDKDEKEKCFHQVSELKLSSNCSHGFPRREMEFKKLANLFPNVKILELEKLRSSQESVFQLSDVFYLIPETFVHLEEINIHTGKELIKRMPDSFITHDIPEMTELKTLQFIFDSNLVMDSKQTPSWLIQLKESLESGILPKLNVCIDCNWTMRQEEVEAIHNIFEPIKSFAIFSPKF